jgi:hypothetical protein
MQQLLTPQQLKYIKSVEDKLTLFKIQFTGKTRKEASDFLTKFVPYAKDMDRLDRGYTPYHTNYPVMTSRGLYTPSHFTVIPEIKNYFKEELEIMSRRFEFTGGEDGDGSIW